MKKFIGFISLALALVTLCLFVVSCGSASINGTYKNVKSTKSYIFDQKSGNAGTFKVYKDGVIQGASSTNEWRLEGDLLTMTNNGNLYAYYKVYGNVLVKTEAKNKDPELHSYTIPKGRTFDWKCGQYTFKSDGSIYKSTSGGYFDQSGSYYVEDNIVYAKLRYSSPTSVAPTYKPLFYIYDGNHVAEPDDVFVKKINKGFK